ncbi:DUF4159 domain-containing protein [candidate division WOR-3 bacterium]|nr:DUF4159 domain-containing protein [candidate division WOR-3 bacterium]
MIFLFILSLMNPSIVRVRYSGGDWYNDPDIITNFAKAINTKTNIKIPEREIVLSLNDPEIYYYPFLFITGHGKIEFAKSELQNLKNYLWNGGFIYVDDDYGMDEYFREEINKAFPQHELVQIPTDHEIYKIYYELGEGLPKIHEHYKGAPKGYGLFLKGRLALFYTYNSNISDGWASPSVYKDPEELREKALKMGINIYIYAMTH